MYANVTWIAERRYDAMNEGNIVFGAVLLGDQNILVHAVPASRPILVRPAEAEWKVWFTAVQHFIKRPFKKTLAAEPVIMVTKAGDPISPRHGGLFLPHFRHAQIVKA